MNSASHIIMPAPCVVPRCNGADPHRFQFPSDTEVNLKWRMAIKKDINLQKPKSPSNLPQKKTLWPPSKYTRVCGAHFKDEDFRDNLVDMYSAKPSVRKEGRKGNNLLLILSSYVDIKYFFRG